MNEPFLHFWESSFNSTPPLGFVLRQAFHSRWIRFHSLPHGKRYAQTKQEMQALIDRNFAVASRLFTPASVCFVVHGVDTRHPAVHATLQPLGFQEIDLTAKLTFSPEYQDELEWLKFYLACSRWDGIPYREILPLVTEEAIGPLLFVNLDNGNVLAPYDGGVDLILRTREERETLRRDFAEYLSDRKDGL